MYIPGQVILYKDGPNIISKLIRLIQGNKITHCAIVVEAHENNPTLLEIQNFTHKVRLVKFSETLSYSDEIYIAIGNVDKIFPQLFIKAVYDQYLNHKYSGFALINAMINHFIGLFSKNYKYREFFKIKNKYTCSSLVATILNILAFTKILIPSISEPDDFTKAPWIIKRIK
jgi:hypothetical protein